MKTFKQFQEGLSLSQAFSRAGKPGVPSERPTNATTLDSLRARNTSDMARPKGNTSGVPTTPLNQSTYRGRVQAGRNPDSSKNVADNPNFQGPLIGAGSGTRDRMPGTTTSNDPRLPQLKPTSIPTSGPNYKDIFQSGSGKPTKKPSPTSPKPLGTNLAKPKPKPKGNVV